MKKVKITKEELLRQYQEKSVSELCEYYGITTYALYRALDECGIPRRLPRINESTRVEIVE